MSRDTLVEFANNHRLDSRQVNKYEKYDSLINYCFSLSFISLTVLFVIVMSYLFLTRDSRPENIVTQSEIILGSIPFIVSFSFTAFGYVFFRKQYSLDISHSEWIYHKVAVSIDRFYDSDYSEVLNILANIDDSSPQIFKIIPLFPSLPTNSLKHSTGLMINTYIERLEDSDNTEKNIEQTYEDVAEMLVKEITATDSDEFLDAISRIEENEDTPVRYRELILETLVPNTSTLRKISFISMILLIISIGYGTFELIDEQLGMLVTVALFTSYQIYVMRG